MKELRQDIGQLVMLENEFKKSFQHQFMNYSPAQIVHLKNLKRTELQPNKFWYKTQYCLS